MPGMILNAGDGQQTSTTQLLIQRMAGMVRRSGGRRKTKPRPPVRRAAKAARRVSKPARLVKGSPAAKRYMASIRKKRRR